MATVTKTLLVDDIDGSEGSETVRFALDGQLWEIDLNEANAARLRDKLARFVEAATPVKTTKAASAKRGTRTSNTAAATSNRERVAEIRRWAAEAGIAVSSRGRLSTDLVEKYNASH